MENKISAQELYDLMLDTNKKVTALGKYPYPRGAKQKRGGLGKRVVLFLLLFGAALIVTIFRPELRAWLNLEFAVELWNRIYLIYAIVAVMIAFVLNMKRSARFVVCLMAIAPIVCSVICNTL